MTYSYKTSGTCSTRIDFEIEDNILKNVSFTGGCNGNLQAVSKLVEGLPVDEVIQKLGGISCNRTVPDLLWSTSLQGLVRPPWRRLIRTPDMQEASRKNNFLIIKKGLIGRIESNRSFFLQWGNAFLFQSVRVIAIFTTFLKIHDICTI